MDAPVLSTMRHAATSLFELADTCQDLKLREELRQRAQALVESRAAVCELLRAAEQVKVKWDVVGRPPEVHGLERLACAVAGMKGEGNG